MAEKKGLEFKNRDGDRVVVYGAVMAIEGAGHHATYPKTGGTVEHPLSALVLENGTRVVVAGTVDEAETVVHGTKAKKAEAA